MKPLKDLLYGSGNQYLDIVRLLALLGGLTFLVLAVLEFAGVGTFDDVRFAAGWASVLGTTVAAIYARNRSDQVHRAQPQIQQGDV